MHVIILFFGPCIIYILVAGGNWEMAIFVGPKDLWRGRKRKYLEFLLSSSTWQHIIRTWAASVCSNPICCRAIPRVPQKMNLPPITWSIASFQNHRTWTQSPIPIWINIDHIERGWASTSRSLWRPHACM
jgi:hypothetical protein